MEIPRDLLQEIFVRLPYSDVVNFRCVCRSWYNLLSDPDFTRIYASRTPYAAVFAKLQVSPNNSNKSPFLLEFGPNGEFIPTPIKGEKDLVATEKNGTRLLSSRARFSDHVLEKLYLVSDTFSRGESSCVEVAETKFDLWSESKYMIAYVPQINTHKILRFVHNLRDWQVLKAMIFTVGIDCEWRSVDDRDGPFKSSGVSFRGFYHWIPDGIADDWSISTFDFLEENCRGGRIPKPTDSKRRRWQVNRLRVLNDRLSLIECLDCGQNITIWTLEEYGVADSWSKNFVLISWLPPDITCPFSRYTSPFSRRYMRRNRAHSSSYRVVAVLPNGSIILYLLGSCTTFIYVDTEIMKSTKVNIPAGVDDRDNMISSNDYPTFYPLRLI